MTPSLQDRERLRALAGRLREIAELPEMDVRKKRWFRFNALQPERPMVLCFPEGAWEELVPPSACRCSDELLRHWERRFLMALYWWEHIRDDHVVEPSFNLNWLVTAGDYGVPVRRHYGDNRGSYRWDPPLANLDDDLNKLRFRPLSVDREATQARLALARDLFGDLIAPRLRGPFWWSMGLTWTAIDLIGLETLMLAMYDNPGGLHRLMAFLRDESLHYLAWFENEGLLSLNNSADYTGSGGVGYTTELPQKDRQEGSPVRLKDLWGFAESQETVGVSPAMFAEFILPYQLPILKKFGLNCYGCCEAVHERWPWLKTIPNLRRVSVSAWCDQRRMAEALGRRYIFSRKPNPAHICVSFDEPRIREDLRATLEAARGGVLEIIMKDTHTVQNDPTRITRWVRIALEEVQRG
ncbi:MAG: hypothetical protein HY343_12545 [Lentisphaerae bacterium]|nr:hypothetical protein [Lentisphaerota bacterium]